MIDDTKDADTMDNRQKEVKENESTEIAPICNLCGSVGIKAKTKSGVVFWTCPEWKDHQAKNEKPKMVQPDSRTKEQIEFQKELDNL
jgi:hypothetical protein